MNNINPPKKKREFFKSLPRSITGSKGSKEYPLKNIEWCTTSFKKEPDGTIDIEHIRSAVAAPIKSLYDHGFLTIKPMLVIVEEEESTNIANETSEWVTITSYLDKSDRQCGQKCHHGQTS